MLIAVNFHYVRPVFDAPFPGIHGITPEQFESQLMLLSGGGTFVSGADIRAAVRGQTAMPERALVVTFDDGLSEQYEHAVPVLRRLAIPAMLFVNTQPIAEGKVSSVHKIHLLRANVPPQDFLARLTDAARERSIDLDASGGCDPGVNHYKYDEPEAAKLKYLLNFVLAPTDRDVLIDTLFEQCFEGDEASISRQLYMSPEQIAELGRERWIGTHAHEHLPLGLMTDDAAELQIEQSAALLARWTGERPFALSYPYGSREASSPAVAAAAVGRGIEYAFTMERAGNANLTSPLHLARFDNNDMPGGKAARWQIDELFSAVTPRTWFTEAQMAGETN